MDKVLSMVSLATKAGKTVSGEFSVEKSVKDGRAKIVIVSAEASDNTKKKFTDMCTFYNVPVYFYGTKEKLGHYMGKEFRASMAVLDDGFKDALEKQLKVGGNAYVENESI